MYALDKSQNQGEFQSRSEQGIFTGYSSESKAYRVNLPKSKKTIVSRDVKFLNGSGFDREYDEIYDENDTDDVVITVAGEPEKPDQNQDAEVEAKEPQADLRRPRKRGATVSWEELVPPPKRGRGRPRLQRIVLYCILFDMPWPARGQWANEAEYNKLVVIHQIQ